MKFSYLRALAALVLGVALSACGGKASFDVSGVFVDTLGHSQAVPNSGMILTDNGGDDISIPAGATSFTFPHRLSYGDNYDVEFKQQPDHMTCSFTNFNTGSAGHTISISVSITCAQNTYTLGGTATGLANCPAPTSDIPYCLTVTNGTTGGTFNITKPADGTDNAPFTFASPVRDGDSYGVTVLTQPANMNCTVANGAGIMHDANVGNVLVTCVPK